ncbi:unnamed protein product [Didymodactylos carnosus]|uniref:Uncharacterized protein n=1 Tax=Didymodactylos carnosus TaxID=1234261 RepID=A0A815E112_9BILA|nr:unnamed protein product [Didymodactylos carnosus]CAF4143804.1 unnamed protein product [Didymodactylos carnosus]
MDMRTFEPSRTIFLAFESVRRKRMISNIQYTDRRYNPRESASAFSNLIRTIMLEELMNYYFSHTNYDLINFAKEYFIHYLAYYFKNTVRHRGQIIIEFQTFENVLKFYQQEVFNIKLKNYEYFNDCMSLFVSLAYVTRMVLISDLGDDHETNHHLRFVHPNKDEVLQSVQFRPNSNEIDFCLKIIDQDYHKSILLRISAIRSMNLQEEGYIIFGAVQ